MHDALVALAVALAKQAVEQDSESAQSHFELAFALASAKNFTEGLHHANIAFETEPGSYRFRRLQFLLRRDLNKRPALQPVQ